MLTIEDALDAIIQHSASLGAEKVPLPAALDRVLAAAVVSECDSPPFDKSLMDGYAVRSEDTVRGSATLKVVESVMAGQVPSHTVGAGQATRIMTGAPLPAGADAVVPVEKTMAAPQYDDVHVGIAVKPRANVLHRGESMKTGERIFDAGHPLRPQDLGMLAELGVTSAAVRKRPRVAILATGDELVPPDAPPGPGQIRNSNETLLVGLVAATGCEPVPLGIARDEQEELRAKIEIGLQCDMLLLSGGVSAGLLDLVPSVLQEAGVEQVFHKVSVKPGKPVWFGRKGSRAGGQGSGNGEQGTGSRERGAEGGQISPTPGPRPLTPGTLVFGLPGNPVSTFVCFELFAKTALRAMLGMEHPRPRSLPAILSVAFENRGDRPTYHPARIAFGDDGRLTIMPVRWAGSGDLKATVEANGVAVFEANRSFAAGDVVGALLWSGCDVAAT